MLQGLRLFPLVMAMFWLAACVTINVYFPAAAAEQAADRIIHDVWGRENRPSEGPPAADPGPQSRQESRPPALIVMLGRMVSEARAAEPDLDISSPAIRQLTASMESRHSRLRPWYDAGAVGLTRNGLVEVRDQGEIPLADRNAVRQLVSDENSDRNALYRQIAVANGHPEWESDIRRTFAERWVANARSGWYYQDRGGNWVQK
ncbi:YdbL family protein [Methylonatrum kenyense]|uniref:YdbL family protein n=1 Tax=Methylonatrum kenyense TaxID=455253 RepID=UPI0020C0DD97|nr:YdbL family protein [Methylonatrum kenyense]MCK8515508.1 YdbL family protein [Methylonatrum kenyense]